MPSNAAAGASGLRRTIALLPAECALVDLAPGAAVVRSSDGTWRSVGDVAVYADQSPAGLEVLAGKSVW
jgi:hypothetical protein